MSTNLFHLINWGFDYSDLMNMEITEFREFVNLLIENNKKEEAETKASANKSSNKEQKSIGQVIPRKS